MILHELYSKLDDSTFRIAWRHSWNLDCFGNFDDMTINGGDV